MITNFDKYNESIKDFLQPKELDEEQQMVYDVAHDIAEIGFGISDLNHQKGQYKFTVYGIDKLSMDVYYNTDEMKKHYQKEYYFIYTNGWQLWIHDNREGKDKGLVKSFKTSKNLLIYIINYCYPNLDDRLKDFKNELNDIKEFITCLEKAKQILNDN